ncbi:thiosulfate/3-mercaptopyruvate sulfurtransferase [Rhodovulum bhavnagarense]|uniref:Thiosulfate/3-mercaptopyruvate sulfurtransferase n=1 Tax=Rhodovulum bhavnagarense TaxID=992286 RepID=A0A4R2RHN8_9RHOB|nr:rhodanese-like domain-containing protein [Rhodovulum bhavnagarense]TCP61657.1 thiosulfate/3-mercaptopyruvate sulfurtransferase [Rhodovulum bhavnagarense]
MTRPLGRFIAAAVIAALPALAQAAGLGPLTDPAGALAAQDRGALILDIRTGKIGDSEQTIFEAGHIPGAQSAPYNLFRGPQDNPGALVPEQVLTEVLRSVGVRKNRPVIIAHQGTDQTDFGAAARVYWTLKSSGVSEIAILNGGVNAWTAAGLPLETGPASPAETSDFTVSLSDEWLATTQDVQAIADGTAQGELIDARPEAFWSGNAKHAAAARPGTLPQSRYFTHSNWFGADKPSLIQPDRVAALAADGGFEQGDRLVSFCNTGHWAATNWFALSELAGIEGVKLYPESMVGWSQDGLAMDNVPGPIRNLLNKLTGKY